MRVSKMCPKRLILRARPSVRPSKKENDAQLFDKRDEERASHNLEIGGREREREKSRCIKDALTT